VHTLQPGNSDEQPRPVSHENDVQKMPSAQLCGPLHTTSHAHELPQSTPRHDWNPVHATSHGPSPHWTSRHALLPLHVIEQPLLD